MLSGKFRPRNKNCLIFLAFIFFTLTCFWVSTGFPSEGKKRLSRIKHWFILLSYDPADFKIAPAKMTKFDLAILDPDSHPPLDDIKTKTVLIAYLSLGEAECYRSYWDQVRNQPWLAGKNPDWGSFYVDVSSPQWQKIILDEEIPRIINRGFDGLMLDTLDTASFLEQKFPEKFSGQMEAMVKFIQLIRQRYPGIILISNNGFSILPQIGPYLDALLAEDIFTMVDFAKSGYKEVPQKDREYKINILKKISSNFNLPVFVIDYLDTSNKKLVKKQMRRLEALGFKPYIAQKDLSEIY